jgi:hypothetical protein
MSGINGDLRRADLDLDRHAVPLLLAVTKMDSGPAEK